MCLTIPKKVVSKGDGVVTIEDPKGTRQEVKTIVNLDIGDFAVTQQNIAISRMDKDEALELINILKEGEKK